MTGRPIGRAALTAALCASLAMAGCSGERDTSEGRRVEATIKRFALSHGPDACNMLSGKGVVIVYGNGSTDPRVARANCVAHSKRFKGQPVDVTFVNLNSKTQAHATARTLDRKRYYVVALLKLHGRWRIESVTAQQKPG
jgi:hypothetical protein